MSDWLFVVVGIVGYLIALCLLLGVLAFCEETPTPRQLKAPSNVTRVRDETNYKGAQ